MYFSILPLLAFTYLTSALAIAIGPIEPSCATIDPSVTVCAEVFNSTDCSGPTTLVTGKGCHILYTEGAGSIQVHRGSALAGFKNDACRGEFEILAGPKWKKLPQGCESIRNKNMIKSWNGLEE
ncbi:hypothetical protein K504DRAFT_508747 [Pleomassaria siparia CBS 279.74]|uniref:Uncharacterized protein n=1 Tax=Pleomassaria siparia CBS 279.74 TaxID=1314801 RepID=A0A6G1JPT2_9PLEO|nr:hypothetical protein K504DRAFT_508747 [Pleomassaria siparia CBS 279.74]